MSVLSFTSNQLSGTLPSSIGLTLPNLQILVIGENVFFGPIPGSLCNVSKLQYLRLPANKFVGIVPTNLGNPQNLERLDFDENNLEGDFDFLTSLRICSRLLKLGLAANQFEGVFPNSICNLSTQLRELYLGGNQIYGTIPVALENLINLFVLSLDGNLFTGVIPSFRKF